MIAVIGSPVARIGADGQVVAAGHVVAVGEAARAGGSAVEVVGKVGDDATGDGVVLDIAARRLGHVAVLRDAGIATPLAAPRLSDEPAGEPPEGDLAAALDVVEPDEVVPEATRSARTGAGSGLELDSGDLELALRYLIDVATIVVVEPLDRVAARVVADAASFEGVPLIAVLGPGSEVPPAFESAIVLEAPVGDADGAFDGLVGRLAARLEQGDAPADALRSVAAASGWARASD